MREETRAAPSGLPEWAALRDPESGGREEAGFLDSPAMFCVRHIPASAPRAGVLICSSIGAELVRSYRREVLLARALSAQGMEVLRFHYRGTGNSAGDPALVSFDSMRDNGLEAASWLMERIGRDDIAVIGTRWGGLVATDLARELLGAPLVLWEPVVSGQEYFREAFFARRVQALREATDETTVTEAAAEEELERQGWIDVVGFALHRRLYETGRKLHLGELAGGGPRPVLLMQLGKGPGLQPAYAALEERWRRLGWEIDAHVVKEQETWWFETDRFRPEEDRLLTAVLLETTGEWLADRLKGKSQ